MRKNFDLCFYFLLKKKLGKSTFFLVLDKEIPLTSVLKLKESILNKKIEKYADIFFQ